MVGNNKLVFNDATIQLFVQVYLNEHVLKTEHTCIKVEKEYDGQKHIWTATIEPINKEVK